MKKIIVIVFAAIYLHADAQETIKPTWRFLNMADDSPVEDVIMYFPSLNKEIYSDSAGFASLICLPTDSFYNFEIHRIGYRLVPYFYRPQNFGPFMPVIEIDESNKRDMGIIYLEAVNNIFPEVTVTASRAYSNAPLTYSNISGAKLNENNFGEDMPMLLEFTPSVVVTSDAGNGVGYTGIRIRGCDATRVSITINGVPYNDAESQQTYWVDLPDFAASVDDIQIQRGVGNSANGVSSTGGAVNINTNNVSELPFAKASFSAGSFNLMKTSASFGTGKFKDHWFVEGRISKVTSDGFIDRASSDLNSFFITTAYHGDFNHVSFKRYSSTFNIFSGEEHTYQSWGGVPEDSLETNRTYNPYTYENQTDNYLQTHFQWHHELLTKGGTWRLVLNYTKGSGYYEQYEEAQYFSDYDADDVIIDDDTITSSDLVTQKWLDNQFYGAYLTYDLFLQNRFDLDLGAAFYEYDGDHFGKVIWSEYASTFGTNYEWYRNASVKKDGNIFGRLFYNRTSELTYYLDLQLRGVTYDFAGYDFDELNNLIIVDQTASLLFFNPKAGISWRPDYHQAYYVSIARSGKEPNRDDYVETTPDSRPEPEILYDFELGNKLTVNGWQLQATYYYMHYVDQLVLNGQINDVGAYTRINVPESFRSGIEIVAGKFFFDKLLWNANMSFSKNEIKEYIEYVDNWDSGEQVNTTYQNTTIAFSPSIVASNQFEYILINKNNSELNRSSELLLGAQSKYVGKQYIDNTENEERILNPYFVNDLSLSFSYTSSPVSFSLRFIVQNILDHQYETNAWVYRYYNGGIESELNGYFPQAGRNYVVSFNVAL